MTREIPEETRALLKRALRSPASGAAVASAASGSPRAAVKSLRDFDLSPAAVRLQKDLSMVSSSLHEASVKLKDTEARPLLLYTDTGALKRRG